MTPDAAVAVARTGRLYPSLILHGGSDGARRLAAERLGRTLLCAAEPPDRPCGACRHCRRIGAEASETAFHPDYLVLERDRRTVTSVEATKSLLTTAQVTPFEARGQVFVIAAAESLSPGAADALLKSLEEPHESAARHFLLLAPSQFDLAPTLRSRSLALYLGPAEPLAEDAVARLAAELESRLDGYWRSRSAVELMSAAAAIEAEGNWRDPRAERPWAVAAAAVVACCERLAPAGARRRDLLALAAALLEGPTLRLRGITPRRILEGLLFRHLAAG